MHARLPQAAAPILDRRCMRVGDRSRVTIVCDSRLRLGEIGALTQQEDDFALLAGRQAHRTLERGTRIEPGTGDSSQSLSPQRRRSGQIAVAAQKLSSVT